MRPRCYLIDPGSRWLRLMDPKTGEIHQIRTCQMQKNPAVFAEAALQSAWEIQDDQLICPLVNGHPQTSIQPMLEALFAKAPTDRFWFVSRAMVLQTHPVHSKEASRWNRELLLQGIGQTRSIVPFPVLAKGPLFHIHAGAAHTLLSMSFGSKLIAFDSLDLAGDAIDQAIARHIARAYRVLVNLEDACALKEAASSAFAQGKNPTLSVTGLDQRTGFVRLSFPADFLWPPMEKTLSSIASACASFVCSRGAQTMERMLEQPVLLSGGLAHCYGLAQMLEQTLKTTIEIAPEPEHFLDRKSVV